MKIAPPDGSRDPRTEDPTNVWFVHLVGRMALPAALRLGISPNSVSVAGLLAGAFGAACLFHWRDPGQAWLGFGFLVLWLILDGLDGMIARAAGRASALGRFLDGLCDHGVFLILYLSLAASVGTAMGWTLAAVAGAAHAFQSTLYEGERMRFHRRIRGIAQVVTGERRPPNLLVRGYDALAGAFDRAAAPFERRLAASPDPLGFGSLYGHRAWPPLRLLSLLSNNMRVIIVLVAALAGDVRLFWWIELLPLSLIAIVGIAWHRRVEREMLREVGHARREAA